MIVKVLGSVSPHCNGSKNCPGFLITTQKGKILLDCGNGITRNLTMPDDLQDLTIIISHLHRDHYGDLLSIAYDSSIYHKLGYLDKKIKVYIPKPNYYNDNEIYEYNFIERICKEQFLHLETYEKNTRLNINSTKVSFSPNPHDITSYAIKLEEEKTSLVYSGDTGYIGNTIERFAAGTNLLICESTFIKGQLKDIDYHLYAHEAAKIANVAKTKHLLLTHFWPDIDKQKYLEEAKPIFKNTDVAIEGKILQLKTPKTSDF